MRTTMDYHDGNLFWRIARVLFPATMLFTLFTAAPHASSELVAQAATSAELTQAGSMPTAWSEHGPTDVAELKAFLDELLGREMEENHIAGAAVSVVKDGELFFSNGYGNTDIEKGIAVDPERTGFRIGSITKLFTWTALMQLAEQGRLDLDADINTYLDFRIPDTYPQPITIKHLMTHTAGFEETFYESLVVDAGDSAPVREWLVSHMPARVRPPGDRAAYSNYGASLAGYVVERVSGQTYDQYVQEHILDPLGMVHTSIQHSEMLPEQIAGAPLGYTYQDGGFEVFPKYWAQLALAPAGAMQSTATDMARFMIAHLQNGSYSDAHIAGARILKEATAQQMHATLYTPDERLIGTDYGFFDFSDNGQRTIGHSGEADPFNSLLLLLPDQNLGVFVSYNSEGGSDLVNQHLGFQRAFFDHYYPAPTVKPIQPPADFANRAGRFVGSYRITRSSYTTLEKVKNLFGGTIKVSNPGDGTLKWTTPWGDWRFVESGPMYFRQLDGPYGVVFQEDNHGRITGMFSDYTPMFAFEKLKWYETTGFNMALLLGCILVFLSVIPVAVIRFIRSRRDLKPAPRGARIAYWIILGISILNLLFVLGTVLWGNPVPLFGVSVIYRIVLGLGVLAAVLTVGAVVITAVSWKNGYWGVGIRAYYTFATVSAVAFVWFLNSWNLLGWRF